MWPPRNGTEKFRPRDACPDGLPLIVFHHSLASSTLQRGLEASTSPWPRLKSLANANQTAQHSTAGATSARRVDLPISRVRHVALNTLLSDSFLGPCHRVRRTVSVGLRLVWNGFVRSLSPLDFSSPAFFSATVSPSLP